MKSILVTGDSHIGPLQRGLDLLPAAERTRYTFWPLGKGGAIRERCHTYDDVRKELTITSPNWEKRTFSRESLSELSPETFLFLSLPANTSRILRGYSWNTHVPWRLASGEAPLSDRLVEEMIDQDCRYSLELTIDLARVWRNFAVIEAPRFFANATYLKVFRQDVCQHIDSAYRSRVRDALTRHGIHLVAQPDVTISDDGTTKLDFDHENPLDNHHANAWYGGLVLKLLAEHADSCGT